MKMRYPIHLIKGKTILLLKECEVVTVEFQMLSNLGIETH